MVSVSVASVGRLVDRRGHLWRLLVAGLHDQRLDDVVAELVVGPVGGEHFPPGPKIGPQRALAGVAGVGQETDHRDRRAGRAEEELHAHLDTIDLENLVGVDLPGRRRIGHPDRCELVAEQGGRGEIAGPLPGTRAPSCTTPSPPVSLTPSTARTSRNRRRCGCATTTTAPSTRTRAGRRPAPALRGRRRIRPSSSPPRNITSTATRVRMTVAVTKRPGRRPNSRSANLIGDPPPSSPTPGRSPAPSGPRATS